MDSSSIFPMWTTIQNTQSTQASHILASAPVNSNTGSPSDTLLAISRQVTYVRQELQRLLDAQSEGLLSGLGQNPQPDAISLSQHSRKVSKHNPSRLPSLPNRSPSLASSAQTPLRPQNPRRIEDSLGSARKAIQQALQQLSDLKASEASALSLQQESLSEFRSSLRNLVAKRSGIEDSIKKIENERTSGGTAGGDEDTISELSNTRPASTFKSEEARLSSEIHSLETRLYELKARLTHIRRLQQERDNRFAARLSSWKGALADVEKTIRRDLLNGGGLEDVYPALRHSGRRQRDSQGVWSLPKERRTTELVKDEVENKTKEISERKRSVESERMACIAGVDVWGTVLEKVEAVEERMRKEMQKLAQHVAVNGTSPDDDRRESAVEGMEGILEFMTNTTGELDEELARAEKNGWNLLVCAIGAEVEALKQGKMMLQNVLDGGGLSSGGGGDPESSMMTARSRFSERNHSTVKAQQKSDAHQSAGEFQESRSHGGALVDIAGDDEVGPAGSESAIEMRHFGRSAEELQDTDEEDERPPEFFVEHPLEG